MLFNSRNSAWSVCQHKNFEYFYIEKGKYYLEPLGCLVNKVATSLMPIGPTILVEWEE